ncbi:MAG: DUF3747 domain-containing protein [Synechococcales cyanobacterium RU_4_20]|nr:DUF3747 domain-containing protein [Synechococcales cyanobacterium RU_4_20]
MKFNLKFGFGNLLAIASLSTLSLQFQPANASSTFSQKEVDQAKFTLVATPYNGGYSHQLTIIGQLSDKQPCWQENGQGPTVIDPLLLNFDFSGICARGVDGNGYSVRMNNQDMFSQYSPKVVSKEGELQLIAQPSRPSQPPLLIARSHGPAQSFSKLVFEPGWRLTQRTFGDTTLGHFYLTHDASLASAAQSNVQAVPVLVPAISAPIVSAPIVSAPVETATPRLVSSPSAFNQYEINPETVVLMATPYNSGYSHQLTVLEQVSEEQKCWQEQGNSPRVIDPLLLNFDFTGICARGTDGNGYSIRVQGEDLFSRYTPKIIEKEGELRLVAKPSRPNDKEFVIARSQGAVTPFSNWC